MLIIRYRRIGKRNYAQYKIVVAEKAFSVKGRFVEALGSYDPHTKEAVLKEDRINHWIGVGAQCSDSVHNLLVTKGLIKEAKRKVSFKGKVKEEVKKEENLSTEETKSTEAVEETEPVVAEPETVEGEIKIEVKKKKLKLKNK